jgi:class III poly(R)-hydroxyalkanoic acid synthase PhaE subunit
MANDTAPDPMAWANSMQKAQADLMRQWSEMNSAWLKSAGAAGAAAAPAAMPGAEVAQRLLGQFENYLGVTRALWELLGKSATAQEPEQRTRLFNEGLAALQGQFTAMFAPTFNGAMGPMTAGNPWQDMAAAFAGTPGFASPFAGMGGGAPPSFNWPALGPAREQQESWQKLAAIVARCTQAQAKLAGLWNEIIASALRELGGKMTPRLQSGAMPGSMKEIYDIWVESAEAAYSRAAHGAAFMQAQAELSNGLSQLRIAQREMLEEWARQFDLPTRAELNSLHQQVRQLAAELLKLRS